MTIIEGLSGHPQEQMAFVLMVLVLLMLRNAVHSTGPTPCQQIGDRLSLLSEGFGAKAIQISASHWIDG
jgi:hypothetical protein